MTPTGRSPAPRTAASAVSGPTRIALRTIRNTVQTHRRSGLSRVAGESSSRDHADNLCRLWGAAGGRHSVPVQYRSLTEAATVSTPAMVPPLLLSDRGSHANAVGVNARANTKPGLPPSTMSVSHLASCASMTTRGSLPRNQKTAGVSHLPSFRRPGRGTVRCSRYLRARHGYDDGDATGSRGRAPTGGRARTSFPRGGGPLDCADRRAAWSGARDREGLLLMRREAPCCIPGAAGRDSEEGPWV